MPGIAFAKVLVQCLAQHSTGQRSTAQRRCLRSAREQAQPVLHLGQFVGKLAGALLPMVAAAAMRVHRARLVGDQGWCSSGGWPLAHA